MGDLSVQLLTPNVLNTPLNTSILEVGKSSNNEFSKVLDSAQNSKITQGKNEEIGKNLPTKKVSNGVKNATKTENRSQKCDVDKKLNVSDKRTVNNNEIKKQENSTKNVDNKDVEVVRTQNKNVKTKDVSNESSDIKVSNDLDDLDITKSNSSNKVIDSSNVEVEESVDMKLSEIEDCMMIIDSQNSMLNVDLESQLSEEIIQCAESVLNLNQLDEDTKESIAATILQDKGIEATSEEVEIIVKSFDILVSDKDFREAKDNINNIVKLQSITALNQDQVINNVDKNASVSNSLNTSNEMVAEVTAQEQVSQIVALMLADSDNQDLVDNKVLSKELENLGISVNTVKDIFNKAQDLLTQVAQDSKLTDISDTKVNETIDLSKLSNNELKAETLTTPLTDTVSNTLKTNSLESDELRTDSLKLNSENNEEIKTLVNNEATTQITVKDTIDSSKDTTVSNNDALVRIARAIQNVVSKEDAQNSKQTLDVKPNALVSSLSSLVNEENDLSTMTMEVTNKVVSANNVVSSKVDMSKSSIQDFMDMNSNLNVLNKVQLATQNAEITDNAFENRSMSSALISLVRNMNLQGNNVDSEGNDINVEFASLEESLLSDDLSMLGESTLVKESNTKLSSMLNTAINSSKNAAMSSNVVHTEHVSNVNSSSAGTSTNINSFLNNRGLFGLNSMFDNTMTLGSNSKQNLEAITNKVLEMAARNLREIELQLNPQNLGRMKIKIDIADGNQASVAFSVTNSSTKDMLLSTLDKLKESLGEAGFSLVDQYVGNDANQESNGKDRSAYEWHQEIMSQVRSKVNRTEWFNIFEQTDETTRLS